MKLSNYVTGNYWFKYREPIIIISVLFFLIFFCANVVLYLCNLITN